MAFSIRSAPRFLATTLLASFVFAGPIGALQTPSNWGEYSALCTSSGGDPHKADSSGPVRCTARPTPNQPQGASPEDQRRQREARRQRDITWFSEEGADYAQRGDWPNAVRSLEEALDNDPDNEDIARDLASARSEQARAVASAARARAAALVAIVVPRPPPIRPATPVFRHSGNGLVGGATWQMGYYSPVGASPRVRARALEMLRDQARRQGVHYDEQIDLERYNFAIGIAKDTTLWRDLSSRVIFEQLRNGQLSTHPDQQNAYNSLVGRQFDELGCHSNGAMTCLAALMNGQVRATNVVLYGPQITVESMAMWNRLLAKGTIKSLEIVVAENDPVPALALLLSPVARSSPQAIALASSLAAPLIFKVGALEKTVGIMSPKAVFSTFSCGTLPSRDCHDMARYSDYRRRCPVALTPKATVPGTRITGSPNSKPLTEPPSPRCG